MAVPITFAGQNWLIVPAVNLPGAATTVGATGVRPPTISADQQWLLVLTGVVSLNFPGNNQSEWIGETITIAPDVQNPLNFALTTHGINRPPVAGITLGFNLEMWAPYAAISGVFSSQADSIDAGFALNVWRPTHFIPDLKDSDGKPVPQVFQGINVDIAVRNTSVITAISYDIMLVGRIVFLGHPVVTLPVKS